MSGFVYLIGPKDWALNRVKIGFSTGKPIARLKSMQTGCPFPLQVYGFFRGDMAVERLLHATFASLREQGEWFRLEGKLLALVGSLFAETYGEEELGRHAMDSLLYSTIMTEEPPPTYPLGEWRTSAETENMGKWLSRRMRHLSAEAVQ